jgi:hypothetical protein
MDGADKEVLLQLNFWHMRLFSRVDGFKLSLTSAQKEEGLQ